FWKEKMASLTGYRVGIVWQGNPKYIKDRQRSIKLNQFAPLAANPNVHLLSLQVGPGAEQLAQSDDFRLTDLGSRFDRTTLADAAAVLMNLDLLIAVDTSVVHLAGALGVPVWVPLPMVPDWRWLQDREDTPWYPTMRLFRQTQISK